MADFMHRPGFRFYQSANADAETIKEDFIIRRQEYEIILEDIRRNPMKGSVQHYLLLGRRGSGKSTLLKRIQVEIDTDKQLRKTHIAINLAEEQANIYKLYDLLEAVIKELEYRRVESSFTQWEEDEQLYARNLFAALHKAVVKSGKKLVLLLDNIDRIFDNLGDDAALLREYLLNYDDVKIIGGSTRMTEHFWKYNKPFYEFFRVLELKALSSGEIRQLLLHWAEKLKLPALKEFVEHKAGQLEMIRILTDGLPRTLQFFVDILLTKTQETGYEYLRLIMDIVTPLYQERLNNLPPAQRKIVLQMAFLWEAGGAKELAAATKMDNKVISAQLKQLSDKGIAEKIETGNKNHLYRLSERFFNLWLIFTQGNPHEKRRARYLTIFLENFYDAADLKLLAAQHLDTLKEQKMLPGKAALLTKALAQSKYISSGTRDELVSRTLDLKGIDNELKQQLPLLSETIWAEVSKLIERKEFKKALQLANEFEQDDENKNFFLGCIYHKSGDMVNAEEYYLLAIEKGDVDALHNIANIYYGLGKLDKAEIYYLKAIENDDTGSMNNLAALYEGQGMFDLAEKYYLRAIEKERTASFYNLALLYYNQKINKRKALEYIDKVVSLEKNDTQKLTLGIVINLWNGMIEVATDKLMELIESEKYDMLEGTFIHLLIHHQENLMLRLFANETFGRKLLERFQPIYYVASLIGQQGENIALKIPPELRETVDYILRQGKEKQAYYYGNSEIDLEKS